MKTPMIDKYLVLINKMDDSTVELLETLYEKYSKHDSDLSEEDICEWVLNDAGFLV